MQLRVLTSFNLALAHYHYDLPLISERIQVSQLHSRRHWYYNYHPSIADLIYSIAYDLSPTASILCGHAAYQ